MCDVYFVCIRGQYLNCVLCTLIWALCVLRGQSPRLCITSITLSLVYVFVEDSFMYTYLITCVTMWSYLCLIHVMYFWGICYMILVCPINNRQRFGSGSGFSKRFCSVLTVRNRGLNRGLVSGWTSSFSLLCAIVMTRLGFCKIKT